MTVDTATATPPPLTVSDHRFTTWDGVELFYRAWRPAEPATRTVILVHRGHEHSGRLADVVEALHLPGVSYFAWDARGHGRSPGLRGYGPAFGSFVRDLDRFVRHVCETEGRAIEDVAVIGHSVGGVIAGAWVHDYAPRIRALVLATPALRVRLYVPLAIPGLRMLRSLRGDKPMFIKSYVKGKLLTHDEAEQKRYDEDPLIERAIAVNILLGLYDAGTRLIRDAGAIKTPTLVLSGGSDWVVDIAAQQRFFTGLGSPVKRLKIFAGMYHDILHERGRESVIAEIRDFLAARFAETPPRPDLIAADKSGHTFDEYKTLCRPLSAASPKRYAFAAQRLGLNTLGRLSRGVRIGWKHGFDSGKSLDYVYDNRSNGAAAIGKLIDRAYLNAIGWRGIRIRREHLRRLLLDALRRSAAAEGDAHLVELACGCGRYTLEAIADAQREAISVTALLRDFDPGNVEQTRRTADRMGVAGVSCEQADAFDEDLVARLDPRPSVAVVSGLYELFPSNEPILRSLRGLAAAVRPGGYFVYTNQPWHPQVELIARTLPNRDGQPWVMRRRTQAEMDQLVESVGFEKLDMLIDDDGIFSVSLARRVQGANQ